MWATTVDHRTPEYMIVVLAVAVASVLLLWLLWVLVVVVAVVVAVDVMVVVVVGRGMVYCCGPPRPRRPRLDGLERRPVRCLEFESSPTCPASGAHLSMMTTECARQMLPVWLVERDTLMAKCGAPRRPC